MAKVEDPARRGRAACDFLTTADSVMTMVRKIRNEALAELRAAGWLQRPAGDLVGLTRVRIGQIEAEQARQPSSARQKSLPEGR